MTEPERGSGFDYIQHCKDVIASIDPDELGDREIGELVGRSSRMTMPPTSVYALGSVMLGNEPLAIALKDDPTDRYRLSIELRDAAILSDIVPQIVPMLPYFMGGIALEDNTTRIGILTEDATRGGSVELWPTELSDKTKGTIYGAFSAYDRIGVNRYDLGKHSTFVIDDEERILDLFPSVIDGRLSLEKSNYYTEVADEADEAEDAVTVKIKRDSALAQSAIELGLTV